SAALARHWWPRGGALGRRLRPDQDSNGKVVDPWYTIVGVAGDVHQGGVVEKVPEIVYYPLLGKVRGDWVARQMRVVVRAASRQMAPESLAPAIRRELARISADLPVANVRTLEEVVHGARSRYEFSAFMVLLATAIAVALGAVGLYGFVSYLVGQRSAEIGIRMALGATERGIRWLVVREALATAAAGLGGRLDDQPAVRDQSARPGLFRDRAAAAGHRDPGRQLPARRPRRAGGAADGAAPAGIERAAGAGSAAAGSWSRWSRWSSSSWTRVRGQSALRRRERARSASRRPPVW